MNPNYDEKMKAAFSSDFEKDKFLKNQRRTYRKWYDPMNSRMLLNSCGLRMVLMKFSC